MIPCLHKKGRSFRGAAAYVLHDKDAGTTERVAFTHTVNLASDNPETAWRLMAATAMDQPRLKQQAGIKNTGRKSSLSVLHLTLGWHPDEADGLTPEAMVATAESALAALGAQEHQALIVAHSDEPHPHVHVLLNRVNPNDGRMLSSSREKLVLSRWAENYEREQGQIRCDNRVVNNAARDRGEYVRGMPAKARPLYEAEQLRAANDNGVGSQGLEASDAEIGGSPPEITPEMIPEAAAEPSGSPEQGGSSKAERRRKDAELSQQQRDMEFRHAQAWGDLQDEHRQAVTRVRESTRRTVLRERDLIRQQYRPRWVELHHERRAGLAAFEKREASLIGRLRNRFQAIDLRAMVAGQDKGQAISDAFGAMTSRSARLQQELRLQEAKEAALRSEQSAAEALVSREHHHAMKREILRLRQAFVHERSSLMLVQGIEESKVKAQWATRNKKRDASLALARDRATLAPAPGSAAGATAEVGGLRPNSPTNTNEMQSRATSGGGDLLPSDNAGRRAEQIEAHKRRLARRKAKKQRDQKRERDGGDRGR